MVRFNSTPQLDARGNLRRPAGSARRPAQQETSFPPIGNNSSPGQMRDAGQIPPRAGTGNPFSGQTSPAMPPAPVFTAPVIAPPPPMTNRPAAINLGTH